MLFTAPPDVAALQSPTPRVAVLLVGGLRGLDLTRARAFNRHVLAPLATQTGGSVDLFACFEKGDVLSPSVRASFERAGASVLWPNATSMDVEHWTDRLHNCYLSAKEHEPPERPYNFFLRTRPDLMWEGDFLPVNEWSTTSLSTRFRVYAGSKRFTAEHQSYSRASCGYGLPANHPCAAKGAECFIPDDMHWIVPAKLAEVVMRFGPHLDDNSSNYQDRNWCDAPYGYRLLGDRWHCNSWAEMHLGYYLARNGVEVQLLAARAWLLKHGPLKPDVNWTTSYDCSGPRAMTHAEQEDFERRSLMDDQVHASTEDELKERQNAERSRQPAASSTALAPRGSDVMLFTAPPDELSFPLTSGEDISDRTDLPCDDGPYVLDLCDCGEGLGSSFNFHKTALSYATALHAKYIDLPQMKGDKIESAEPVLDDPNVRRANVAAAAAEPPHRTKKDIFDAHDKLNYSPFFGLGSARCNAASLRAHRAANTTHLTFVDAVEGKPKSTWGSPPPTSPAHFLCARLESGLGGVDRPSNELFETDPLLSRVSTELDGHTPNQLGKLVLVFKDQTRHIDLNYCAISPDFRKRWRTVQHLEARPRNLAGVPTSERVIAVHFRWGDVATNDVNNPDSTGRAAPLSQLAKVTTDVRRKLGGDAVRVLLFTEPSNEDRLQGRSDEAVAKMFSAFTDVVPNTELRLAKDASVGLNDRNASTATSTPQDLMDMAQADVLIGGRSTFFVLAGHLSEGVVFTTRPDDTTWRTAAGPSSWAGAWGPQPDVMQRNSTWGKHIQLVGYDASGPEVVYDGAWCHGTEVLIGDSHACPAHAVVVSY